MHNNSTGDYNTAYGKNALYSNTAGHENTAIGEAALQTNNGTRNTAIGSNAGAGVVGNNSTTFLGAFSNNNIYGIPYSNSTAIGYQAIITASNQVRIGNASVTSIGGVVGWSVVSDGRFKMNMREDVKGLEFILKLRPVTYNLDLAAINKILHVPDSLSLKDQKANEKIRYTGFVAQEVEKAAQETGFDFSGLEKPKTANDNYALKYAEFVVPLVKAMQEQQALILQLKKELELLKSKLNQ